MLVFIRLSTMIMAMPVLGYATVSVHIRIMLAFILTLIIAPIIGIGNAPVYESILPLMLAIIREVLIGLFIGFGARLIFEGFAMAGSYIGYQMGMAIMNVFDPSTQQQQPIISNFWLLVIVVFFLVSDSHHFLIGVLFQNFDAVPLGMASFSNQLGHTMIEGGRILYELALQFAAPAMVFLLSIDIAISFMARVMPQLNIFFISLPLKIGAGIFLLVVSLKIFQTLFGYIYNELEIFVLNLLRGM